MLIHTSGAQTIFHSNSIRRQKNVAFTFYVQKIRHIWFDLRTAEIFATHTHIHTTSGFKKKTNMLTMKFCV